MIKMGGLIKLFSPYFVAVILSTLAVIAPFSLQPANSETPDPNNFYFESFDAVYELSRDAEGRSTLKTTETITAVFPEYDQNRGFIRDLVRVYDGHDTELTVLSVTDENGQPRNHWIEESGDFLELAIAVPEGQFVHGKQIYLITYQQKDVTRFFADTSRDEFYWDVNGTGWSQHFERVSARVLLSDSLGEAFTNEASCYYGRFGETNSCQITRVDGNLYLEVENLRGGENVTFALGFEAGSFQEKPAPFLQKHPFLLIGGFASFALAPITAIWGRIYGNRKNKSNRAVIPIYSPPEEISPALAARLVGAPTKAMTATLLDLAVKNKIRLLYDGSTKIYGAHMLDSVGLGKTEREVVKGIFGSAQPVGNSQILWFKKTSTKLGDAAVKLRQDVEKLAKDSGLLESRPTLPGLLAVGFLIAGLLAIVFHFVLIGDSESRDITLAVGINLIVWASIGLFILAKAGKIKTKKGSEIAHQLEGLKEYMRLAEADRIKMLQSASGVEISSDHVLQIYERLLPYAVLFNQENEWQNELQKYYTTSSPEWFGVTEGTDFRNFTVANFANTVASSRVTATSSGSGSGSSYSSFSGGSSGGGFSGGGGGGGGGRGI